LELTVKRNVTAHMPLAVERMMASVIVIPDTWACTVKWVSVTVDIWFGAPGWIYLVFYIQEHVPDYLKNKLK